MSGPTSEKDAQRQRDFVVPMFTIYDRAADRHEPPMVFPTRDVAVRRFKDMVNTAGTVYFDHPEDFVLEACGNWNMRIGEAEAGATDQVMTAKEVHDGQE